MKNRNKKYRILAGVLALALVLTAFAPAQRAAAEETTEEPGATNITFDTARDLKFNTSIAEEMSGSDTKRYYKFSASEASVLSLGLNKVGTNNRLDLYIYDKTKTAVFHTYYSNTNAFAVNNIYLTGGDYYVGIVTNSSYSMLAAISGLNESFTETQEENNNGVKTASAISFDTNYKGVTACNDDKDYYSFTLTEESKVTLNLTNSTNGTLKYTFYDSAVNLSHTKNVEYGKKAEDTVTLAPDTYYLEIAKEKDDANGSYGFLLSSVKIVQPPKGDGETDDPGNFSLDKAKEMEFGHTYGGDLQGSRYYKFSLAESSEVKVSVSKYANLDVCAFRIYDAMKTPIYEKKDVMNYSFGSEGLYLLAGQYYFEVSNDAFMDGYTKFSVAVNGGSESISETQDSLNNSAATASGIVLGQKYKGILAQNDAVDYYKFVIPNEGKTSFSVQNACASSISISIEDAYANSLGSASVSSGKTDTYSMTMSAGTYYFKVAQKSDASQGAYIFTVSHVQTAPAATKKPSTTASNAGAKGEKAKKAKVPTGLTVKNKASKKAVVRWKAVSGASGYMIEFGIGKKFRNKSSRLLSGPKVKCSVVLSSLKKKKTYYVRIRSFVRNSNGLSTFSKWSKAKKVKIRK